MLRLITKNPKNDLDLFDQFTKNMFSTDLWDTGYRYPSVDIYEKDDLINFEVEVPGVPKENINVTLDDGVLTISGEIKNETEDSEKNYYRTERKYGNFSRAFNLGEEINEEDINAKFEDGILRVSVPIKKPEKKEAKKIEIK